MATELCDTQLFDKLSSDDMTDINDIYHKQYLTAFYNKHFTIVREEGQKEYPDLTSESIAFAELLSYIEENQLKKQHSEHIFKLSNLVRLYRSQFQQLSSIIPECTNSTGLKKKLLTQTPELQANKSIH